MVVERDRHRAGGVVGVVPDGHPVQPVLGEQLVPGLELAPVQEIGLAVQERLDHAPKVGVRPARADLGYLAQPPVELGVDHARPRTARQQLAHPAVRFISTVMSRFHSSW